MRLPASSKVSDGGQGTEADFWNPHPWKGEGEGEEFKGDGSNIKQNRTNGWAVEMTQRSRCLLFKDEKPSLD